MTKALGLMLTIIGAILAWWFVQQLLAETLTPFPAFIVAAIAVAALSVGIRYLLRKKPKKTASDNPSSQNPTDP